jgi:hypothetical protein
MLWRLEMFETMGEDSAAKLLQLLPQTTRPDDATFNERTQVTAGGIYTYHLRVAMLANNVCVNRSFCNL